MEMICADFLAGANVENGDTKPLRLAIDRLFRLLSSSDQMEFLETVTKTSRTSRNARECVFVKSGILRCIDGC